MTSGYYVIIYIVHNYHNCTYFLVDFFGKYIVYSKTLHMIVSTSVNFPGVKITLGYWNNVALMCLQRVVKVTNYICFITIIYTLFHFDIRFGFCCSGI